MAFTSKKQMSYMFAVHPRIAKKMAEKQKKKKGKKSFKNLPKKARDEFSLDTICIEDIQSVT